MLVDYERAFLELRARLLSKRSWGQRELLALVTEIEVQSRLPEGERGFDPTPLPRQGTQPTTAPLREVARHG